MAGIMKRCPGHSFLEVLELSRQTPGAMGAPGACFSVRLLRCGLTEEELVLSAHPGSAHLSPAP